METFSALLAFCAGNSPVTREFPAQRPVTRSFDVFFDQRLNKRLSKQSWRWWFGTPSRPLWRHCNDMGCKRCYGTTTPRREDMCRCGSRKDALTLCKLRHRFGSTSAQVMAWCRQPVLTNPHRILVAFTWGQFSRNYTRSSMFINLR